MSASPGWYADPQGGGQWRWWDGSAWTEHVQPAAEQPMPVEAVDQSAQPSAADLAALRQEYKRLRALVIETREVMLLQEVGLYEYSHPLDSSTQFKGALAALRDEMKEAIKADRAVKATDTWAINGSNKDGAKMVGGLSKLLLRAYNTEADNLVRAMKPFGRDSAVARLEKTRASISKLAVAMKIEISDEFHDMRVREIELTSDYLAKVSEEREREREERERLRDEATARKQFEREQAKLEKERAHYEAALQALREIGDPVAIAEAEAQLGDISAALAGVLERAANIRAGYVYVISNVGAFGEGVVKIGMTRRLDPLERVHELGGASVPFRFDVHCIIFSDDAVGLEGDLHRRFAPNRVNFVNLRREFFYTGPADVRDALLELRGELLSFTEAPEAPEWHQSENIRHGRLPSPLSHQVLAEGGPSPQDLDEPPVYT